MTSAQAIGSSRAVSRKAGTTRKVTAVSTPSAPRPIRAAWNRSASWSAEQDTMLPSASTISSAVTWAAMPPRSRPVPWVPVWIAPATVCSWMSPMFARASPRASRCSLRSRSRAAGLDRDLPGRGVHRPDGAQPAGAQHHPGGHRDGGKRVTRSRHPHAQPVQCGQRDGLGDLRGRNAAWITRAGAAAWLPAQFCQRGDGARTMPGPYPSGARPRAGRSPGGQRGFRGRRDPGARSETS